MFSKSKRFNDKGTSTPGVGQYDVSKRPCESAAGAALFPKDKRFKEPAATNGNHDTDLLDISNCSSVSAKSSGSCYSGFATPAKPYGKIKNVVSSSSLTDLARKSKSRQVIYSEEDQKNLEAKISKLQDKLERLKSENEELIKDVDGADTESKEASLNARIAELTKEVERLHDENKVLSIKLSELESAAQERQMSETNLTTLNNEVEKLRKEIEEEILKNKELLFEQNNYECSLKTMQADVELANRQVTALQERVTSLEQINADMSEGKEDLENQCTKLHGLTIALQEDKLTLQERLEEMEKACNKLNTIKEDLEKQLSSCEQGHLAEKESLESALSEKLSLLTELQERRASLEETINVYKDRMDHTHQELQQALDAQMKTSDEFKILKEEKDSLVCSIQDLEEKHSDVVVESQHEISSLKEDIRRKEERALHNLQSLTDKCEMLEDQLVHAQKSRDKEVESLQKELELSKSSLENNQAEYRKLNEAFKVFQKDYDAECQHRLQLEEDYGIAQNEKQNVDAQLNEAQGQIAILRETEVKCRTTAETLSSKLEECKETIINLEKVKAENIDAVQLNYSLRSEVESIRETLSKVREENRSLASSEEKTNKLKQEFGRRLMETQKKLSQKEMELQRCKGEMEEYVMKFEGQESWRRKYEELEERIAPFQEQLNAFELEKQALLNRNTQSQSEIDKLGQQYAKLLGHQNQKQKIRHVLKLKEENANLKKEVTKLQEETAKQKQAMRKLEEKLNKGTGVRKFDPSLAFQHNTLENKENTPLKTRQK